MGTFVSGNTALPPNKTDANPPTGASDELDAADINNLWSAASDLRDHVKGWVNPLETAYGAKMDGATDDSAALALAASDAASKGYGIKLTGKVRVASGSVTIAVPVDFGGNGSLDLRTGGAVTINHTISAPVRQIFLMNGGTITLNRNFNRVGFPEWWGAVPGGADCLMPLQNAVASLSLVQLQQADYYISSTWKINTPSVIIRGVPGIKSVGGTTGGTRILCTRGDVNVMQVGPDSNPGSINSFLQHVRIQDVEISRTVGCTSPGEGFSGPAGIRVQYTLYTYYDRVWSTESLIGFAVSGTCQTHLTECNAFRSVAATSGTDFFWGFALDGSASIGAAGGNASTYLCDCDVSMGGAIAATGAAPITSKAYVLSGAFADTKVEGCESAATQYGASLVGVGGNASASLRKSGNGDVRFAGCWFDQITSFGFFISSLSEYAAIRIIGNYVAPWSSGSPIACYTVQSSNASAQYGGCVTLLGNEAICWPNAQTLGIYLTNCSGVFSSGNIISGSQRPVAMTTVKRCDSYDIINSPTETGTEGAVYLGTASYCRAAPTIGGGAGAFPYGIQVVTSDHSEVNLTGVDPACITGGSANKLVIDGVQITTNTTTGTVMSTGIMT